MGPRASCGELRVSDSSACYAAPLELARKRHPELAQRLTSYASVRETKTYALGAFSQERFFLNAGDCFAVLADSTSQGSIGSLDLEYRIQELGTPDPARNKPKPEPGTGARGKHAALSPEICPWEPTYWVVTWLTPSPSAQGDLRLQLLRRPHPDPARLAQQAAAQPPATPTPARPYRGGSCSDFECGEDCRSEHRACNLDCFRYGRHEMGSDRMCKAGCNQALRSCERSCRVACP